MFLHHEKKLTNWWFVVCSPARLMGKLIKPLNVWASFWLSIVNPGLFGAFALLDFEEANQQNSSLFPCGTFALLQQCKC